MRARLRKWGPWAAVTAISGAAFWYFRRRSSSSSPTTLDQPDAGITGPPAATYYGPVRPATEPPPDTQREPATPADTIVAAAPDPPSAKQTRRDALAGDTPVYMIPEPPSELARTAKRARQETPA